MFKNNSSLHEYILPHLTPIIVSSAAVDKKFFGDTRVLHGGSAMNNRLYYEKLFEHYPDVVTLQEFREMLGGIGDATARKLMRGNHIQHFLIRNTYFIPKVSVISYVMSKHYAQYKNKLTVQI